MITLLEAPLSIRWSISRLISFLIEFFFVTMSVQATGIWFVWHKRDFSTSLRYHLPLVERIILSWKLHVLILSAARLLFILLLWFFLFSMFTLCANFVLADRLFPLVLDDSCSFRTFVFVAWSIPGLKWISLSVLATLLHGHVNTTYFNELEGNNI